MIMPFHHEGTQQIYFNHVKPFLKEQLNVEIFRADDCTDNDIIIDTIYRFIRESEFIVADKTIANKNSFYELGYAAALGKEIITIQQSGEQILFFDRAHIRSIFYEMIAIDRFLFQLKATIEAIRVRK